ncbi:oxidoreductase [Lyngbya aestuarii BL J]|uniref:Oxidoreductase n=1 Tax=Lyngbya aestuarii BL J TaxID=1348334 RepID=U7QEP3_9CYAN|nr:oxidoreductase [Lyngbya aestuarii BL J]
MKRLLRPEEIANLVTYLCSEQSSGTTGAALRVEGGIINTIA